MFWRRKKGGPLSARLAFLYFGLSPGGSEGPACRNHRARFPENHFSGNHEFPTRSTCCISPQLLVAAYSAKEIQPIFFAKSSVPNTAKSAISAKCRKNVAPLKSSPVYSTLLIPWHFAVWEQPLALSISVACPPVR